MSLFPDEQHRFTPGRSVVSNLLLNLDRWTEEFDRGSPIDVVYLDFERAFDQVPLRRLITKLEHVGVRGDILAWITSFLIGRRFRVRVGSEFSTTRDVLSGVPQGSVLGPILFVVYTADLLCALESHKSVYADDTKIFENPLTSSAVIQSDLDKVIDWASKWLLNLNVSKCSVLHMGRSNPHRFYNLDGTLIGQVEAQVDLGVTIRSDLKWESHIINIVKKANSIIYLVRKAFSYITTELFLKIYKCYIRPILEFGFQIWTPYFQKDIELLERVQRRATKILPHGFFSMPYEQRLDRLNLTSLQARRERGDLIEVYKILHGHYSCPNITSMFALNRNPHLRGHSMKLSKGTFACNPRKYFLSNRVFDRWNSLPPEVVEAPSVLLFKIRLDRCLAET